MRLDRRFNMVGAAMHPCLAKVPRVVLVLALLTARDALCQQLSYLPLQRPGQASVAVDRAKRIAFIFGLGSDQDGREIRFRDWSS